MLARLYRKESVANACERLHQLSNDNQLNDQTIDGQRLSKPALAYAEGIRWLKGIYSFLAISCWPDGDTSVKSDIRLIAPSSLRSLSPPQSAAFSAACLTILESQLKWLDSGDKPATEVLASKIGYPGMVEDVQSVLDCCARGLSSGPSQQLVADIQSAVRQGQRRKDAEGKWDHDKWHNGVNSSHLYEHMPLQVALSCLEATRLNGFETMTCVVSCLKTGAVYRCDGDPLGAPSIEMEDAMTVAIPALRRVFRYIRDRSPNTSTVPCFFPRGFLSELESFQQDTVSEEDLLSSPAPDRSESADVATSPHRTRESVVSEMQAGFRYQVFISYKNLGANGNLTEDASLAEQLYHFLCQEGFAVFFSNLSLAALGQSAYSKAIDQALDSSQILVVVSTSPAHLESDWVRYEWDSFFNDIISGIKPNGRVFAYVKGVDVRELPRKLRQGQVFHHEREERDSLCSFIRNALI